MRIRNEHYYHGAVLNQIAEHEQFTAINGLEVDGRLSRSAFKVNNDIAVYIKYAGAPVGQNREYRFTFNDAHRRELRSINEYNDVYLALVCVRAREVCCFSYQGLSSLLSRREEEIGYAEDQYTLIVTLRRGESFRVGINAPGVRGRYLDDPFVVQRNACPNDLFR